MFGLLFYLTEVKPIKIEELLGEQTKAWKHSKKWVAKVKLATFVLVKKYHWTLSKGKFPSAFFFTHLFHSMQK